MLRIEPVSQNVCLQWPLAGCPPKEVRFEGGGEGLNGQRFVPKSHGV